MITNTSFTSVIGSLYANMFQYLFRTSSWLVRNGTRKEQRCVEARI